MTLLFVALPPMLVSELGSPLPEHWKIYVPAMLTSVVVMIPILRTVGASLAEQRMIPWAFIILAVAMSLVPFSGGLAGLGVLIALYFLGFNLLEAAMPALLSRITGSRGRGRRMGVYSTFQFLGAFFGGVAGGWLLGAHGSGFALIAAGVVCLFWGGILIPVSKRFFLTREAS